MSNYTKLPMSPEVRAYAEMQRMQEFDVVNQEAKSRWWRKLGAQTCNSVQHSPESQSNVSREIISADEIVDRTTVEQLARQLIDNYEPSPKRLREQEAEDNARTALFEALTASGHMSVVTLEGDPVEVHEQVLQRLLNAYFRSGIPPHEKARNFEEICEELVVQATFERMQQGDVPSDTKINTLSDYAHPLGSEAQKLGYRPSDSNDQLGKGMIRETSFEQLGGVWTRVIKQISRSNTFAPTTIAKLQYAGLQLPKRHGEADVQLLGSQMLSVSHGALEVVQLLDHLQRGFKVMYGEPATKDTIPYEKLEEVSQLREAEVEFHVKDLADYERELDDLYKKGSITEAEHTKRYVEALREHVRAICVRIPTYTKGALGQKVVDDYYRAHTLYEAGDSVGAQSVVSGASGRESAVSACGMSTTVENNTPNSPESSQKQSVQSILERSLEGDWTKRVDHCPICGSKDIMAQKRGDKIHGLECGCWSDVCTGKYYQGPGRITFGGQETQENIKQSRGGRETLSNNRALHENAKRLFGERAIIDSRVTVGDQTINIIDSVTGDVLLDNVDLAVLSYMSAYTAKSVARDDFVLVA